MKKNNLLNITDEYSYKPFRYPDAYNFYSVHEDLHWTKKEIELSSDAKDWNTKDWDNYMKNKGGVDSSIVGNSQLKIQNFKGSDDALSANPNALQSQNIKNNTKYNEKRQRS